MSHAVTSVMFCYVNTLRWITGMSQQPRNVKHQYPDTKWETGLMYAEASWLTILYPTKTHNPIPCTYSK